MCKLTKKELRATRTLVDVLRTNGISFENAAMIVGMRLKYLCAFSISNVALVFRVGK